ncbi:MAG: hypothetical protein BWY76_03036 [bacterium ADurb.Bin429]|nr:MAG: hypothetical protein BWY76_03036 [bacterium ADurb.Bin429]
MVSPAATPRTTPSVSPTVATAELALLQRTTDGRTDVSYASGPTVQARGSSASVSPGFSTNRLFRERIFR